MVADGLVGGAAEVGVEEVGRAGDLGPQGAVAAVRAGLGEAGLPAVVERVAVALVAEVEFASGDGEEQVPGDRVRGDCGGQVVAEDGPERGQQTVGACVSARAFQEQAQQVQRRAVVGEALPQQLAVWGMLWCWRAITSAGTCRAGGRVCWRAWQTVSGVRTTSATAGMLWARARSTRAIRWGS
ncbi:hypothetical protein OID54_38380 (plasmid) [Streptomyces sp. NBC_00690]